MGELHRYALLVPPVCRLAKPWRVSADGYVTLGTAATAKELRTHHDGPYNIHSRPTFGTYAYWKKVQPVIVPKYDPLSLMSPLMRSWTEPLVEKRDKYDYDYGRGVGMVIHIF
ncbi:hypothetical protein ZWY2020_019191 [Hordeum vulgare]|nr:hypothetical protein ZWY2020_019191 [Hordeum vulgare]